MTRTALITGGYVGIGFELAKLFAKDGYRLILAARNAQRLESAAAELRGQYSVEVVCSSADLAAPDGVHQLWRQVEAAGLQVDVLVNNAGLGIFGEFKDTDLAAELAMMHLNMDGLVTLTKLALPGMVERRWGRILQLGSIGSFFPCPYNAVYCASKAFVLSFSRALNAELAGTGVSCTCLCPGITKTEFHSRAAVIDRQFFANPRSYQHAGFVAREGYAALMAGREVVTPGFINRMQVRAMQLMPQRMLARILGRVMAQ